jgi:hypothetical protein
LIGFQFVFFLVSVLFDFYFFDQIQLLSDDVCKARALSYLSLAFGTLRPLNGLVRGVVVSRLNPLFQSVRLECMLAIVQIDKPGTRLILFAKKHFGYLVFVTNAAQRRTCLSTEPNTPMTTFQALFARFSTRLAIAQFMTELCAF